MTEAETNKSQARRAIAAVFLRDSANKGMSWRSRTDCAFDAVYLYALAVLGAQADNYNTLPLTRSVLLQKNWD